MPGRRAIFAALRATPDPTVDAALATALPTADPRSLEGIVELILERERPDGLLGLVLSLDRMPPRAQRLVVDHAHRLHRPIRETIAQRSGPGPGNAIRLIRESLSTRLAYLVTEALRHGPDTLKDAAAHTLLHLAESACTHGGQPPLLDPTAAGFLQDAVEDAVVAFGQHRRQAVLLAFALLLPRPMPKAMACLAEPDHAASAALTAMLRRADHAAIRRATLTFLGVPTLAQAAVDGLRAAAKASQLGDAMEPAHMLAHAPIGRTLSRWRETLGLAPDPASAARMGIGERRGLVAYLAVINEPVQVRVTRLLQARKTPDAVTRIMALRRLIAMGAAGATVADDAVAEFTTDADAGIARAAMWHLIRRRYAGLSKVLATVVNSRHDSLRRLAGERLAPVAFAKLWTQWSQLPPDRRLAAGRALLKIDPTFHRELGGKLAMADRDTRVRALSMICELGQGEFFTDALFLLARSSDPYVVSTAVKALGTAHGEAVIGALQAALGHDDARVRANAVEALAQHRAADHVDKLVRLAEDPHGRPRANAIAALMALNTGDAVGALSRMLVDQRPEHRRSALWLIETVGVLELARLVAELAVSDPDFAVKERAQRAINLLMGLMSRREPAPLEAIA